MGERWGHNYDLIGGTASEVWYRAAQNCEAMIASGVDPLRLVCEHTHRRGMAFLGHLLLGLVHTPPSRVTNGRATRDNHPNQTQSTSGLRRQGVKGISEPLGGLARPLSGIAI